MLRRAGWFALAFVIAGFWIATAAALSGNVQATLELRPSMSSFQQLVANFNSTLTFAYSFSGWTFGSLSTYNLHGFAQQQFSATGFLGALTIDSTLKFNAQIPTTVVYGASCPACVQTASVTSVSSSGSPTLWTNSIWPCIAQDPAIDYTVAFSSWLLRAQTSLFGAHMEGLFYLKGDDFAATTTVGKWIHGDPYKVCDPSGCDVATQTGSYTATSCLPLYGSGWKFTLSGMIGQALLTSRTYFNLEEYSYNDLMARANLKTSIADTFKMGESYYLPKLTGQTCNVAFTREFLTLEGLSFGCATIDTGLNMTCDGFGWLKVLAKGIAVSPLLDFDALLTFQTQSKSITIEPQLNLGNNMCFTFHAAWNWDPSTPSVVGFTLNGISFSYTLDNLTFTSATSFNPTYESLGGYYIADHVSSPTSYAFYVPDTNLPFNHSDGTGYYVPVCFPNDYYLIWEKASVQGRWDGCCGGTLQWTINTYFGSHQELIANSFWFWYADESGDSYQYNTSVAGQYGASVAPPAVLGSAKPYCEDDAVSYGVAYYNAGPDTLLGWVRTDASLSLPIGSSITMRCGLAVDAYGWQSLRLGCQVSW